MSRVQFYVALTILALAQTAESLNVQAWGTTNKSFWSTATTNFNIPTGSGSWPLVPSSVAGRDVVPISVHANGITQTYLLNDDGRLLYCGANIDQNYKCFGDTSVVSGTPGWLKAASGQTVTGLVDLANGGKSRTQHMLALHASGVPLTWSAIVPQPIAGFNIIGNVCTMDSPPGSGGTSSRVQPVLTNPGNAHWNLYGWVKKVEVGAGASYAVSGRGRVLSWGYDNQPAMSLGLVPVYTYSGYPNHLSGPANIKDIDVGWAHVVTLAGDGTVWCWGLNSYSQAGKPATAPGVGVPASQLRDSNNQVVREIKDICVSHMASFALKADGTVLSWGKDFVTGQPDPVTPVPGLNNIVAIYGGLYGLYALRGDGTLWYWHGNAPLQLTGVTMDNIVQFSGDEPALALRGVGRQYQYGQTPQLQVKPNPGAAGVKQVSRGAQLALVLDSAGKLHNQSGNLLPAATAPPSNCFDVSITNKAGTNKPAMTALRADGTLWFFGFDTYGLFSPTPNNVTHWTQVPLGSNVPKPISVRISQSVVMLLGVNGAVWTCGNVVPMLGAGSSPQLKKWNEVVGNFNGNDWFAAIQIDCSDNHCLALRSDGHAIGWGSNAYGQITLKSKGLTFNKAEFVVDPQGGTNWTDYKQIACGAEHSIALCANGGAYTWGRNRYGELGRLPTPSPTAYDDVPKAVKVGGNMATSFCRVVGAGGGTSYFVNLHGDLFGSGLNASGQLTDGTTTNQAVPSASSANMATPPTRFYKLFNGANAIMGGGVSSR